MPLDGIVSRFEYMHFPAIFMAILITCGAVVKTGGIIDAVLYIPPPGFTQLDNRLHPGRCRQAGQAFNIFYVKHFNVIIDKAEQRRLRFPVGGSSHACPVALFPVVRRVYTFHGNGMNNLDSQGVEPAQVVRVPGFKGRVKRFFRLYIHLAFFRIIALIIIV